MHAELDDDEDVAEGPFDPVEPPPIPKSDFGSLKKIQELMKAHGYILTAIGPIEATFYPANVKRDKWGLIPEDEWRKMSRAKFNLFLKGLRDKE